MSITSLGLLLSLRLYVAMLRGQCIRLLQISWLLPVMLLLVTVLRLRLLLLGLRLLDLHGDLPEAVDDVLAHLPGEDELDLLALGLADDDVAALDVLGDLDDPRHVLALDLHQVLALDLGDGDLLQLARLGGFREGQRDVNLDLERGKM